MSHTLSSLDADNLPALPAPDVLPLAEANCDTAAVSALALPPEGFEAHLAKVGCYLERRFREIDAAQTALDAVQEAFAYAVRNPIRNLSALVMCVAKRKASQAQERARREETHAVPETIRATPARDIMAERLAMQMGLKEALKSLPDDDRAMFLAHYICGYSHEEISLHFRTSVSAVKSRLLRVRRRLKEHPSLAEFCPEQEKE